MDGSVIIKAVLDTVDVSKNIKALERDLQGISWKNITEGDEKAASCPPRSRRPAPPPR